MMLLIILFPLIGSFINAVSYLVDQKKQGAFLPQKALFSGVLASACLFASFCVSLHFFIQLVHQPLQHFQYDLGSWIQVGSLKLPFCFVLDPLSSLFTLLITGIGTLIHIYSIGYMQDDPGVQKFFSFLNLFCAMMLILVLGSHLALLFVGWEGVGLCSYFLIGFWYSELPNVIAGKKAFIVNRIGDCAFILACFWLFSEIKTLEFSALSLGQMQPSAIAGICFLFFIACTGKSAQIPLYVWLPDAMAGPTPVSALIHAATMVTSGIYLISRLSFLFQNASWVNPVIAWIGVLTAFFSGGIALFQKDIKKVLAYSTVSQLGFMFLACGVGAYHAAVFHVITHAFFKALLFLAAGSVIHGNHGEQDLSFLGGLLKKMPQTALCFAVGCLAICGIPPFSGFFSKDEILFQTFCSGGIFLWAFALISAFLTAIYMTRLFILTFLGDFRGKHPAHESGLIFLMPLSLLAFFAFSIGWIGIPHAHFLEHFLESVVVQEHSDSSFFLELFFMGFNTLVSAAGIWLAFSFQKQFFPLSQPQGIRRFLENKGYIDVFFEKIIVQPVYQFSQKLFSWVEIATIDAAVLRLSQNVIFAASQLRRLHTGSLSLYVLFTVSALIFAMGFMIYGLA